MVEGGQRVISSFLTHEPPVVQCVIITIAPCIVGSDGVGVTSGDSEVRVLFLGSYGFPLCVYLACVDTTPPDETSSTHQN